MNTRYLGGPFDDDDVSFPRSKREYQAFRRFDKALKDAQTKDKEQLSKNVNLAAQIAAGLSSTSGIRHVVSRLCQVSKAAENNKETAVYTADSIMRHVANGADDDLRLRYERHLQVHMRNIFKRTLRVDSTRRWLADRYLNKILTKWKEKGWFDKELGRIVEVVMQSAPDVRRPTLLDPANLVPRAELPFTEEFTTEGPEEDDTMLDNEPLYDDPMGGAIPKACPATPAQPDFLMPPPAMAFTASMREARNEVLGRPEVMTSVPSTPNVAMSVPRTPVGASAPMTPGAGVPMTPMMGGAPMTPRGAVPMTPKAGMPAPSTPCAAGAPAPSTPIGGGVPRTPKAGMPAPSTPMGAIALGAAPSTPRAGAAPRTPRPVQPYTPRAPAPPTPNLGSLQPFTPSGPAPPTPGLNALQPFTPRGPSPATPLAGASPGTPTAGAMPFTPRGPPPATPAGFAQPFTPRGPTPSTPGGMMQPFTPRGPSPATPGVPMSAGAGVGAMPFTPRGPPPATPSNFFQPFTPRGPAPGSAGQPGTPGVLQPFTPSNAPFTPAGPTPQAAPVGSATPQAALSAQGPSTPLPSLSAKDEVTPQALDHPEPSIPSIPKSADAAANEDTPQQTPPAEAEGEVTPQQIPPQTPKKSPSLKHPVVEQTPDSEKEKGTPLGGASPIEPTASASEAPRSATPIASNSPMPKDDEMTEIQQPVPSAGSSHPRTAEDNAQPSSPSKRRRLNPDEEPVLPELTDSLPVGKAA